MLDAGAIITLESGRYRLCRRLATSAYGVVWQAQATAGQQPVALKLINSVQMERAHPAQRARWIESARNETAFLRSLQPWDARHIVRLLDSGEHQGLPVLALELLDSDLARHVAEQRQARQAFGFDQVLDWIAQLNAALAKVHQYGWRYLDLKPSNILIDARRGTLKLADFGTNCLLDEAPTHTYAGTASWQSPEQFFPAEGQGYLTGARSDYFALGALFYYLVTGGQALRYCGECGAAYREHGVAGAALLRERRGGALPPTLNAGEAALFVRAVDTSSDSGWFSPARSGAAALALLRSLLDADPEQRPPHAIAISRALAEIRGLNARREAA